MNSKKIQKAIAYYTRFFLSFFIAVMIYGIIAVFFLDIPFWEAIARVWYLPIVVPVIIWGFNRMVKRPEEQPEENNEEWDFLKNVSNAVRRELNFKRADFKELRNDDHFRQFMSDMFELYQNGESEELIHEKLVNQFESIPKLHAAAKVVSTKTIAMREETQRQNNEG